MTESASATQKMKSSSARFTHLTLYVHVYTHVNIPLPRCSYSATEANPGGARQTSALAAESGEGRETNAAGCGVLCPALDPDSQRCIAMRRNPVSNPGLT